MHPQPHTPPPAPRLAPCPPGASSRRAPLRAGPPGAVRCRGAAQDAAGGREPRAGGAPRSPPQVRGAAGGGAGGAPRGEPNFPVHRRAANFGAARRGCGGRSPWGCDGSALPQPARDRRGSAPRRPFDAPRPWRWALQLRRAGEDLDLCAVGHRWWYPGLRQLRGSAYPSIKGSGSHGAAALFKPVLSSGSFLPKNDLIFLSETGALHASCMLRDVCERASELSEECCPSPFSRQGSISLRGATFVVFVVVGCCFLVFFFFLLTTNYK